MKKLDVYFCGWGERWRLATLAESGQDLLFEYSAHALEQGIEFSPRHLKLRAEAYGDFPPYQRKLPGLIADCRLPAGRLGAVADGPVFPADWPAARTSLGAGALGGDRRPRHRCLGI